MHGDGFTLFEIMAALAVMALALTTLLQFNMVNLKLSQRAGLDSSLALIAESVMEQKLSHTSDADANAGRISRAEQEFIWQSTVTRETAPLADEEVQLPMRRVTVVVSCLDGKHQKVYELTRLIPSEK